MSRERNLRGDNTGPDISNLIHKEREKVVAVIVGKMCLSGDAGLTMLFMVSKRTFS